MHKLTTDPIARMRFDATGRLPQAQPAPSSPLIELLRDMTPAWRARIGGLEVGPELGYMGSRRFATASQALLWLSPSNAGDSHPAESWRDKRYVKKIFLGALLARCSSVPEGIEIALARLMEPETKALMGGEGNLSAEAFSPGTVGPARAGATPKR